MTLKIEGNYTLTDSLIIEDGGVLTLEPGSTLNLDSASSVYCAGDIYVNGTETNKVTINFLQSNETKQNSIYLGRESSAIIKYAQIKNGYSGITATNGFDTLIIDNCNFTNISHSALLLNGNGYDNAKIKNNTYTNCDYAGFFSNLATVAVNSDSANTTSGYYFSNVSNLWFGNNKLTGTQEGPGMTLTGCFGNIYNNKITDHTDGILLAHSFPKIGGNEIINNTQRGLVCEYGSTPDLETFSEAGVCEQINTYPLSGGDTTNAITETEQYHAQTEELTIALRGTTQNRNMKNDVGSITTLNKSGMNNLMKRHGNKFTIKKEPKPVEIITEYSLSQNYPNPFNSSTIIEYALPKDGLVSIKLYDITGRLVKQLVNEQKPSGRHKTTIESGNLASGIYIYSLRVNDININKKLVILK
ncbi:MAG: T9SS type A sorting domain-containing protein [Ignavibacteriales bacterium]|nr:T9SS type A sorting domain-containing protein [Ignavibacteriales bacterium]